MLIKYKNNKFVVNGGTFFYLHSQPRSDSSVAKVVILQTTGSPQGTGENYGTFGASLRGALKGWGMFLRVLDKKKLFSGRVPDNNKLFSKTLLENNLQ